MLSYACDVFFSRCIVTRDVSTIVCCYVFMFDVMQIVVLKNIAHIFVTEYKYSSLLLLCR